MFFTSPVKNFCCQNGVGAGESGFLNGIGDRATTLLSSISVSAALTQSVNPVPTHIAGDGNAFLGDWLPVGGHLWAGSAVTYFISAPVVAQVKADLGPGHDLSVGGDGRDGSGYTAGAETSTTSSLSATRI